MSEDRVQTELGALLDEWIVTHSDMLGRMAVHLYSVRSTEQIDEAFIKRLIMDVLDAGTRELDERAMQIMDKEEASG